MRESIAQKQRREKKIRCAAQAARKKYTQHIVYGYIIYSLMETNLLAVRSAAVLRSVRE